MGFFFLILGSLLLLDVLFWRWADRKLRARPWLRGILAAFMLAMLLHVVWILVWPDTARRSHEWLATPWIAAAYLWHLLVLPLSMILVGLGLGVRRALPNKPRPAHPTDPSRRSFLAACAALAPPFATGAGVAAALPTLNDFRVRRLRVALPRLPAALDGVQIAHVSDIHYGKFTEPEALEAVVAAVNRLEADLVLLTGDLIDLSLGDLPAALEVVHRFDRRQGLFMCEGNHDLIDDGEEFRRQVKGTDVPLLLDEARTVRVRGQRVQLLGVRWRGRDAGRRETTRQVLAARDASAFPILLSHHPHSFDYADDVPLTLSGHTHGGLLMLNERLGPGPVLYRYWSGLYTRGDRALVVSNGVGNWFPVRTRAPAEIIHLTLTRGDGA
ncbi:MAG: metallophosphoesterase [Planctomycetota bacterium]